MLWGQRFGYGEDSNSMIANCDIGAVEVSLFTTFGKEAFFWRKG